MELICEVVKVRKWIGIRNSGGVKAAVITTRAPAAVFLWNHMERRGPGTIGTANNALLFKLKEFLLG
jgi:hypothetical protein